MAVDFCSQYLKTKISTYAVSSEDYEVSNLISNDLLKRGKGFLAEGFTKPPISIILTFYCNIEISHILIWTEVGCQKSNGIELLLTPGSSSSKGKVNESDQLSEKSFERPFVKIGSGKLSKEAGLAFRKYSYHVTPAFPLNFSCKYFNSSSANVLRNAKSLEIKIFSTLNSSVPALKRIEVWGQPSRSCELNVKQYVYELCNQANHKPDSKANAVEDFSELRKPEDCDRNSKDGSILPSEGENGPKIPDEFLDPITFNVMAIPMALPSGKVVDLSTLEKFNDVESSWGRGPSDPFTGVSFTKSVFPIPDTALKSRIDKFLLENGHLKQFKGVGRTVGQKSNNSSNYSNLLDVFGKTEFSEIGNSSSQKSSVCFLSNPAEDKLDIHKTDKNFSQDDIPCTSFNVNIPVKTSEVLNVKLETDNELSKKGIKRKCATTNNSYSPLFFKRNNSLSNRSHEDIVEHSLDSAVGSVLSGLPSFVNTSVEQPREAELKQYTCTHCGSLQCLFSLPCEHVLCRSCLVTLTLGKTESLSCIVCNKAYSSMNVKRFHIL